MYGFRVDFTVPPNWEYVEAGPASAPLCGELMRTVSFFLFSFLFYYFTSSNHSASFLSLDRQNNKQPRFLFTHRISVHASEHD